MRVRPIIISVIAGFVVGVIVLLITDFKVSYAVQIEQQSPGKRHVTINNQEIEDLKPNQDGILFIYVTGATIEYNEILGVEVQVKDTPHWFKQDDVEPNDNNTFNARIQLGSREWHIRGGEQYNLKVSAGDDTATAKISVHRIRVIDPKQIINGIIASLIVAVIVFVVQLQSFMVPPQSQNVKPENKD